MKDFLGAAPGHKGPYLVWTQGKYMVQSGCGQFMLVCWGPRAGLEGVILTRRVLEELGV